MNAYLKFNYFASAENLTGGESSANGVFPHHLWPDGGGLGYQKLGLTGGCDMPKRLRALILGTEDAVPGDYILSLIAVFGVMLAVIAGMLA